MPSRCNYCKQIKKCRKSFFDNCGYPNMVRAYEGICKDCDDYNIILHKESIEKRKEEIKEFIKKRDTALKKVLKHKHKRGNGK